MKFGRETTRYRKAPESAVSADQGPYSGQLRVPEVGLEPTRDIGPNGFSSHYGFRQRVSWTFSSPFKASPVKSLHLPIRAWLRVAILQGSLNLRDYIPTVSDWTLKNKSVASTSSATPATSRNEGDPVLPPSSAPSTSPARNRFGNGPTQYSPKQKRPPRWGRRFVCSMAGRSPSGERWSQR